MMGAKNKCWKGSLFDAIPTWENSDEILPECNKFSKTLGRNKMSY